MWNDGPYWNIGAYGRRFSPVPSLRLTKTSPTQSWTEPLTKAQVEKFLSLEYGLTPDTKQQDELDLMITEARAVAEQFQGRDLVRKQWDMVLDYWTGWEIELREPLVSVDLFTWKASDAIVTTMVENTDFLIDAAKGVPVLFRSESAGFWPHFSPWRSSAILVRFTSGYTLADEYWKGDGAIVRRGMLQLIAHWFDNRDAWTREVGTIQEFPFMVTQLLSAGKVENA